MPGTSGSKGTSKVPFVTTNVVVAKVVPLIQVPVPENEPVALGAEIEAMATVPDSSEQLKAKDDPLAFCPRDRGNRVRPRRGVPRTGTDDLLAAEKSGAARQTSIQRQAERRPQLLAQVRAQRLVVEALEDFVEEAEDDQSLGRLPRDPA